MTKNTGSTSRAQQIENGIDVPEQQVGILGPAHRYLSSDISFARSILYANYNGSISAMSEAANDPTTAPELGKRLREALAILAATTPSSPDLIR